MPAFINQTKSPYITRMEITEGEFEGNFGVCLVTKISILARATQKELLHVVWCDDAGGKNGKTQNSNLTMVMALPRVNTNC